MKQTGLFISGKWREGRGDSLASASPANGQLLWEGAAASSDDALDAVSAAENAFPAWSALPFAERAQFLAAYQNELKKDKEHLAETISQETGKPLWEALTEVGAMIAKIKISLDAYHTRCEEKQSDLPHATSIVRAHPHGPVAILGPYNFPGHLPGGHIIPALLAGNTVVFKPSEKTPLTAIEMTACWERIHPPAGVWNLVPGGGDIGQTLLDAKAIRGVFFTGSFFTGQRIQKHLLQRPEVILALEMGGNNPLLVTHCRNRDAAVYATLLSSFLTTGQRCTCARRLILPKGGEGDDFLERLISLTKHLSIAPYDTRPEPFMGPMIDSDAADALLAKQSELEKGGAEVLLRMERLPPSPAFVSPSILDVTAMDERKDEEIFGPLLQVIRTETFDDAIREANNTAYGLSAGLLSDNPDEYATFRREIHAGIVNWNTPLTGASSAAPFGGIGQSGNFRPGAYYAADYCSYPVASMENREITLPKTLSPGVHLDG